MKDCIFCKIASGEISADKLLETDNFFVVKDVSPLTEGHSLVIPKKHYESFLDIPSFLFGEYMELTKEVVFTLLKETKSEGFNLLMNNFEAGQQQVRHAHLHIIPRKLGDGKFDFIKK
jgi:histidine triad (HIT) family protein